jgi:hypothetical protein
MHLFPLGLVINTLGPWTFVTLFYSCCSYRAGGYIRGAGEASMTTCSLPWCSPRTLCFVQGSQEPPCAHTHCDPFRCVRVLSSWYHLACPKESWLDHVMLHLQLTIYLIYMHFLKSIFIMWKNHTIKPAKSVWTHVAYSCLNSALSAETPNVSLKSLRLYDRKHTNILLLLTSFGLFPKVLLPCMFPYLLKPHFISVVEINIVSWSYVNTLLRPTRSPLD